jgi:hypothetical protein
MLQFPSNWAAIAGRAEQMIATATDRAKAHMRFPIMGVLLAIRRDVVKRSPGDGGTPGLRVPFGGEPVMGREAHHKLWLYTPLCI